MYYDGYGNYDCPTKFVAIKPLKEVKKKIKKCVSREFDNEENKQWIKFVV